MSPRWTWIVAAAVLAVGVVPTLRDARGADTADTADSLLADLPRLAAVQEGCKANTPWANEALCRAAATAIRRRFHGEGVPYTPHRVDPFPAPASPAPPSPAPTVRPGPQVRQSAGAALLS